MAAYVYVWEFEVAAERQREFEGHYGPAGTWAGLFRQSPDYVETLLLHDLAEPSRFITVDRWRSAAAYRAFRAEFSAAYDELDRQCDRLTLREAFLGEYSELD